MLLEDEEKFEEEETDSEEANDESPVEVSEEEESKEVGNVIEGVEEGIKGGLGETEIGSEIKNSFLDYAMSVIVSRALPDARDGFKPVHRRIIYGMAAMGMYPDKPFKKSARIVGDVMGKYHPHGDSAIYGTMARLAQDFAMRYTLVDGHGNYGSQDGDEPAAMRYTEARLSKLSLEMVKDMNKDTVDFMDTYDGEGKEPQVLPARFPNLLVNGSSGIAVGMATNIPPHNLKETISACQALLKNPELTPLDLMVNYMHGPDFPGGGLIVGRSGIKKYFETGQGVVKVRGKYSIEENNGRTSIVFTEVPYMVNKKELAKKIVELADNKVIEGISSINDYSSHKIGTRFQIDLKKGANVEIVLNHLFKYTKLQDSFAVNILALDNGAPKVLNVKQALTIYNKFQCEVIERRTKFDLNKAQNRRHILDGLLLAIDNIDEVISIIRSTKNPDEASTKLIERFGFTDVQTKAILDMKLQRLTGLERDKLSAEDAQLVQDCNRYQQILSDSGLLKEVVYNELEEVKNKYGDERKTEISDIEFSEADEDLIEDEEVLIALTQDGYIKRMSTDEFRIQNRGGIGVIGMTTKQDDVVSIMTHSRTKIDVLFFTNLGKVYRIRGYQIPEGGRTGKGLPVVNLLKLGEGERVLSIISATDYDEGKYLFFATKNGIVKRTKAEEFKLIRTDGKIAISLNEGDSLIDVKMTDGSAIICLAASSGKVCTFYETDVRTMGRSAAGVKGITLDGAQVVGCSTSLEGAKILAISENGYGKITEGTKYRLTSRGSKGVMTMKVTDKVGSLVTIKAVDGDENILIITAEGTVMKTSLTQLPEAGRATQGVRVIRLKDGEHISSIAIEKNAEKVIEEAKEEEKNIVKEKNADNSLNELLSRAKEDYEEDSQEEDSDDESEEQD